MNFNDRPVISISSLPLHGHSRFLGEVFYRKIFVVFTNNRQAGILNKIDAGKHISVFNSNSGSLVSLKLLKWRKLLDICNGVT